MNHSLFNAAVLMLLLNVYSIQAQEITNSQVQWHGFLTQGFIQTSDNSFFGDSENGSFDLTELGLSASYRASESVLLAGQVLSRNAGEMYDATLTIDFLLIDYTLYNSESGKAGVRLGRIKNSLGLYNETRDVAFTRPGIFLPEVIYFDKVRNLVLSSDGLMFYHDIFTLNGNYSMIFGAGKFRVDKNVEIAYLIEDRPGKLRADGLTMLFTGFYTAADETVKLGLSAALSDMKYSPGAGDFLQAGNTNFKYWVASAQYNQEKWSLSAEYMQEPIQWENYGPFFPDNEVTAEAFYLQSTFRLLPKIEFMFRYEEGYANKDDKNGVKASALTGGFIPAFNQFSKVLTVGIRRDISPVLMVRAEYQVHEGTFILSSRENQNPADLVKDWNLLSLLASYRF